MRCNGISCDFRILRYRLEKDNLVNRMKDSINPPANSSIRELFLRELSSDARVSSDDYTSSDALSVRTTFKGIGAELILIDKVVSK